METFNEKNPFTYPKQKSVTFRLTKACYDTLGLLAGAHNLPMTVALERAVFYLRYLEPAREISFEQLLGMSREQFAQLEVSDD